jgi:hypothetical protein
MFRAMVLKELRELSGIVICSVAAQVYLAIAAVHPDIFPFIRRYGSEVPFLSDEINGWLGCICVLTAIAMGARQTLGESIHGTYLFLYHRPASRRWLIGVKLLVGMSIYMLAGPISIVCYGLWAATPGTHPSPFEWWMTKNAWLTWLGISILYPGMFLTGIRPGRWVGTRPWPLVAAVILTLAAAAVPSGIFQMPWLSVALIIIIDIWLIGVILYVAQTSDYA